MAIHLLEDVTKCTDDAGGWITTFLCATLITSCNTSQPRIPHRAERAVFELVDRGLQPQSVTSTLACFINPARVELLSQRLMQDDCLIRSYTHFHVLVDNQSCR